MFTKPLSGRENSRLIWYVFGMSKTRGRPAHPDTLTPAEWRVAEAVRHGLTNPEIAAKQGVSVDTVKFHVSNIIQKLGFNSRAELRMWDGVRMDSRQRKESRELMEMDFISIGQIARFVSDVERATKWFRDKLGLPHLYSFGELSFFDCGGVRLFLNIGDPTKNSIIYFNVLNIHAAHDHLKALGVEIVSAPHMIHQHEDGTEEWMAFINDADQQPLGLMSRVIPDKTEKTE